MPLTSSTGKTGVANCAGPCGLLEMRFSTCCLLALAMCCSNGGIDGVEFVLGIVLETLDVLWRVCKLDQTKDSCCELCLLCENEGHGGPGRASWVLMGLFRYHIPVETSVGLWKEEWGSS